MNSLLRREKIALMLNDNTQALSASYLAEKLGVSRQIIVGDIALLRATGHNIISTPKGYILSSNLSKGEITFNLACTHNRHNTKDEMYAIVDNGGTLLDVTIEHPIYGQLVGQLNISSRIDADEFICRLDEQNAGLLLDLTNGVHLHTISCKNESLVTRIKNALRELGVLLENE